MEEGQLPNARKRDYHANFCEKKRDFFYCNISVMEA